jgi:S1-C subfamily serine protease
MGYMGFSVTEKKDDETVRLIVTKVDQKSNANFIGIEPGDQILQVSGIPVSSIQALSYMLRSYPPGSSVSVVLKRASKTLKGKIAISDYPADYGITVLKNNYGLEFEKSGKFITVIKSGDESYIRRGDILIAINNTECRSMDDLNKMVIDSLGETAVLSLYRDNTLIRLRMPL